MSMQRILETSRKLGLPVIVTDIAGREPMVVLPLEQFEAMAGAGGDMPEVAAPAAPQLAAEPAERPDANRANTPYRANGNNLPYSGAEAAQPPAADPTYQAAMGVLERHAEQNSQNSQKKDEKIEDDLPMEDRFYVEPLDDVGGG